MLEVTDALGGGYQGGAIDTRDIEDVARDRPVQREATVMRLDQRYAGYLAVGDVGYMRTDIRSNDVRAAVVLKSATS